MCCTLFHKPRREVMKKEPKKGSVSVEQLLGLLAGAKKNRTAKLGDLIKEKKTETNPKKDDIKNEGE